MLRSSLLVSAALSLAAVTVPAAAHAQTTGTTTQTTDSSSTAKKPEGGASAPASSGASDSTQSTMPTPKPGAQNPASDATAEKKEEAEKKRAVYMNFDLGFTRPDLGGFSDNLGFDKTAANGATYAIGAGLRLGDLRFGAKWRAFDTTEFNLWAFMAEVGYSFPSRPFAPGIVAHLGYVKDEGLERRLFRNSLPPGALDAPDVDLRGAIVGAELQAMYWVSAFLRAGAYLGFDVLMLSRPRAGQPPALYPVPDETLAKPLYSESGSGVGYALSIGARGAFDIAF